MSWAFAFAFAYDANGNQVSAHESSAATFDRTPTFHAANQSTSSGYSYYGAGNLTASPGATYVYNGAEQMTSSTFNGATTSSAYAGASQAELRSETTGGEPAHTYMHGRTDGTGVAEIDTETTNATSTSRVLSDAVTGQALDLTNGDGADRSVPGRRHRQPSRRPDRHRQQRLPSQLRPVRHRDRRRRLDRVRI